MPGPAPKPLEIRQAEGTMHKAQTKSPIRPTHIDGPEPPDFLDEESRQIYHQVAGELDRLGMLTELDVPLLAAYAFGVRAMIGSIRILEADGPMRANRQHPAWNIFRESSTLMMRAAQQFGLSPSARSRITSPIISDDEEFERMFLDGQDDG